MPTDDRDEQFERALARHFSSASPDSACPDAETLAAYHERTLSREEMVRCKEHLAGCLRCQESLALVEQTETLPREEWEHQNELPSVTEHRALAKSALAARAHTQHSQELPSSAPIAGAKSAQISKMRPRPPWRWILPVGAIAASVIVWVGVREIRTQHLQQLGGAQVAQNRPASSQLPQPRYDASRKEQPPAEKTERETLQQKLPAMVRPNKVSPPRSKSLPADNIASQSENALAVQEKKDTGTPGAAGRLATPQPTPPTASYAVKSRAMESTVPPPASARAPAPAAHTTNASADEKKKEEMPKSVADSLEVTTAAPAQVASVKAGYTADLMQRATTDRRLIVAPGEEQAWRLGDAGKIERSTDRGKTWRPQQSGVTADLTAGSCTSDKVCWVIGRSGTLLLTTDGGKQWKLLSSPIPDDLGGIHATDAFHATIWDVPNRQSFETSDGGATWYRTANE